MRSWICLALAAVAMPDSRRLPHDAYVWQRQWTPALREAIALSEPHVECWRILGAEVEATGAIVTPAIDPAVLHRPVTMVIRLNRHIPARLPESIAMWLAGWRKAGVSIRGLELDYDCPTAQLPAYRTLLQQIRREKLTLSITALPTWIQSRDLPGLLASVDETVLQLHSVLDARQGLFDAAQARRWIRQWSALGKPFRVALPAYGSRVAWYAEGGVAGIESETPRFSAASETAQELFVTPAALRHFLDTLPVTPQLRGVTWFRLPTAADRRAWSLATWHAVMQRQPLVERITVERHGPDIIAVNGGNVEAELPSQIRVRGRCSAGDGLQHYRYDSGVFHRTGTALLKPGQRQPVGWLRCQGESLVEIH